MDGYQSLNNHNYSGLAIRYSGLIFRHSTQSQCHSRTLIRHSYAGGNPAMFIIPEHTLRHSRKGGNPVVNLIPN